MSCLFYHRLTPWNRVISEKLIFAPVVKKFPAFYRPEWFITVLYSGTEPNSETDQLVPHPHNVFISFIIHLNFTYVTLDLSKSILQYTTMYIQSVKL